MANCLFPVYRTRRSWAALLGSTLVVVLCGSPCAADTTITGKVIDEADAPISNATVSIYTAKPKEGLAITCPSCYRDCAKYTQTADDGSFSIGNLDSSLLFRVLVASPGRRSLVTTHLEPGSESIEVKLQPIPRNLPDEKHLRGRVVDKGGRPIAGAVIDPYGAKTATRRWWGRMEGVDETVVSDADGRFIVYSEKPMLAMDLHVKGRGYATTITPLLNMGGTEHEVALQRGASVSGRLLFQDEPVCDRAVGIVQVDRGPGKFVGELAGQTNQNGELCFYNLQPDQDHVVYTLCDNDDSRLALKTIRFSTKNDGESTDLGDLSLTEGVQFSGKVALADDVPLPRNSTLRLGRDPAWDWKQVGLKSDGTFHIVGLPPEIYTVRVVVPELTIDTSQFRYQMVGENTFGLNMKKDRAGFRIPLRPK